MQQGFAPKAQESIDEMTWIWSHVSGWGNQELAMSEVFFSEGFVGHHGGGRELPWQHLTLA